MSADEVFESAILTVVLPDEYVSVAIPSTHRSRCGITFTRATSVASEALLSVTVDTSRDLENWTAETVADVAEGDSVRLDLLVVAPYLRLRAQGVGSQGDFISFFYSFCFRTA